MYEIQNYLKENITCIDIKKKKKKKKINLYSINNEFRFMYYPIGLSKIKRK